MTPEHLEQLKRTNEHLDRRIEDIDSRLDKHLEIYANNGREMARMAVAIEELGKSFTEYTKSNEEVLKWGKDLRGGQKILVGLLLFVGSMVGTIIGIKTLFGK